MRTSSRPAWSVNSLILVILAVLVLATLAIAYQSGGPPDFLGHTSEEFLFDITTKSQTCSSSSATVCRASCDSISPGRYFAVSGFCLYGPGFSNGSSRLEKAGLVDTTAWECKVSSGSSNDTFQAIVYCLKSGV